MFYWSSGVTRYLDWLNLQFSYILKVTIQLYFFNMDLHWVSLHRVSTQNLHHCPYLFIAVCFLDESHSDWVRWNLSVVFIFIFLMAKYIKYFLVCLLITYTAFNNVQSITHSSHIQNKWSWRGTARKARRTRLRERELRGEWGWYDQDTRYTLTKCVLKSIIFNYTNIHKCFKALFCSFVHL